MIVKASTPEKQAAERNFELREIKRNGSIHERRESFQSSTKPEVNPPAPAAGGGWGFWGKAKSVLSDVGLVDPVANLRRDREAQEEREREVARQEEAARVAREEEARRNEEARKSPAKIRGGADIFQKARERRLREEAEAKRMEEEAKLKEEEARRAKEEADAERFRDETAAIEMPKVAAVDDGAPPTETPTVNTEPPKNEEKPIETPQGVNAPEVTVTHDPDVARTVNGTDAPPDDSQTPTNDGAEVAQHAEMKNTPDNSVPPTPYTALTASFTATDTSYPVTPTDAAQPDAAVVVLPDTLGDDTPGTPMEEKKAGGGPQASKKKKKKNSKK